MPAHPKLLRALRQSLREHADPAKAPMMQAYMKSEMPYLGVQTPDHRRICRAVFKTHPLASFPTWRDAVLSLWREARYREERHAAIALGGALLGAIYPGLKAARQDAIEALAYE